MGGKLCANLIQSEDLGKGPEKLAKPPELKTHSLKGQLLIDCWPCSRFYAQRKSKPPALPCRSQA